MFTRSFANLLSIAASVGNVWTQLMQQLVQKSTTTTRPRIALSASGRSTLRQAVAPSKDDAFLRWLSAISGARLISAA
jgi:hypothetical protein